MGRDLTSRPHDAILQFTFSQREHAAGLLRASLPPEVSALVRWSTLKLQKLHFVDRGLRGRQADLLFAMEMSGDERLYVHTLIEHQRKVDELMIFRMGVYMWRHWEDLVRREPERRRLPVIVPILIHHSDTGWTAATAFEDILGAPSGAREALRPYVPGFRMKLVDVSHEREGGLLQQALTALGRVVLFCLSVAGNDRRLRAEIDAITEDLNALYAAPNGLDALIAVLRYLVATHPKLSATRMATLMEATAKKGQKEVAMDVLDELKREGRAEGRAEGEREGRARTLLEQLKARFGAVPADAKARVLAADTASLARWSVNVLTAKSLDAVLDTSAPPKKRRARAA